MRYSLALVALVALSVAGCQKSLTEKDFVGNWTGHVTIDKPAFEKQMKGQGGTAEMADQVAQQAEKETLTLELKSDKTCSIGQGVGTLEGTWAFADSKVTMTPTKAMGKTQEEILKIAPPSMAPMVKAQFEPIVFTADKEGKSLTGDAPGMKGSGKLNLAKAAASAEKK